MNEIEVAIKHLKVGNFTPRQLDLAIQTLEKLINDKWRAIDINNDDSYPESYQNVFFTDGYEIFIGCCDPNCEWSSTNGEDFCCIDDVKAWKPLPLPYKEG